MQNKWSVHNTWHLNNLFERGVNAWMVSGVRCELDLRAPPSWLPPLYYYYYYYSKSPHTKIIIIKRNNNNNSKKERGYLCKVRKHPTSRWYDNGDNYKVMHQWFVFISLFCKNKFKQFARFFIYVRRIINLIIGNKKWTVA